MIQGPDPTGYHALFIDDAGIYRTTQLPYPNPDPELARAICHLMRRWSAKWAEIERKVGRRHYHEGRPIDSCPPYVERDLFEDGWRAAREESWREE